MSIKHVNAVMDRFKGDPTVKFVLVTVALHADAEGRCYPSLKRIAERVGLLRRQAIRVVSRLIGRGWLVLEQRGSAATHTANVFRIVTRASHIHDTRLVTPVTLPSDMGDTSPSDIAMSPQS